MSKVYRIDQYACIDIDELICEEMRDIIDNDCGSGHPDDIESWGVLQAAAAVVLEQYSCD
jgi:hypothetical protein